jgi:hypothetical protein
MRFDEKERHGAGKVHRERSVTGCPFVGLSTLSVRVTRAIPDRPQPIDDRGASAENRPKLILGMVRRREPERLRHTRVQLRRSSFRSS